MRHWLVAKTEEDRRRQEEERTRQEELRTEQRRIEQSMLRESITGGVPPQLVPLIFIGLAGGPLPQAGFELAQQHLSQLQQSLSQPPPPSAPPQASVDTFKDPHFNAQHSAQQTPSISHASVGQSASSQSQQASVYPSPAYQSPRNSTKTLYGAHGQSNQPLRGSALSALPRLTTNEPTTATASAYGPSSQQPQQTQQPEQASSSPSIYFHHWQPPNSNTSVVKETHKTSPSVPSRILGPEHQSSPRKRKATNPPVESHRPATTTAPLESSPSFSVDSLASMKSQRVRARTGDFSHGYDPIGRSNRHAQQHSVSSTSSRSHVEEGSVPNTPPSLKMEGRKIES